ncbi:SCP-like protein [Teladorsagia circumcincta]|uniref:SCP-like protein n=1 Tax=Teladorsagia circumcincta TaxID=45464 RepID=A0A2G9UTM7_TELCI|nr:SCP-like protein [Teladorsagia circumcincta]
MTDEARQMFLNKHNGYRSLVAKGEAKDGQGGFATKAARMTKMSYDCDVEKNVMSWITKCKYESSSWDDRLGLGENLWMTPQTKMDRTNAADEMVWQSTLKLGCGVEWCDSMTLVGCHYKWSGNFLRGCIYEVGEPCKTDADCKCAGCTCVRGEALCIVP